MSIPRLLSIDEVAEQLGYSRAKVVMLVYRRQIPFLKIGRRVQFTEADIEKWLQERTVRETPARSAAPADRAVASCATLGIPVKHRYS